MISARPDLLALNVSHFHDVCNAVNANHFGNPKKNSFKKELLQLSQVLLKEDIYSMPPDVIHDRLFVVGFFLRWALALDGRNGYTLSHEMRGVLDRLCGQWIPDHDKYVFAETDGDFSVSPYNTGWDVMLENIKNEFGIKFPHLLVIFRVPKQLASDFLYSSVLFHEMGHFVDSYYHISERVFDGVKDKLTKGELPADFYKVFFPAALSFTGDPAKQDNCIKKQICEYLADLFGAQYVGENICNLMESMAYHDYDRADTAHPSPNCRERMVKDFINNRKSNLVLNMILDECMASSCELKYRFIRPSDASGLEKGRPISIQSDDELFSIFKLGWDVFFLKPATMELKARMPHGSLDKHSFYSNLNNAIQESIKNYL